MPKVVISEFMDTAAFAAFDADVHVLYDPTLVDQRDALHHALADADALIVRNRTQVDAPLLDAAPKLRVIGRLGVGLENIDLAACAAREVAVKPATGANTQSVVEYVIASTLLLRRKAFAATGDVIAGAWPRGELGQGGEVAGLTLGLVGFGAIARAVAGIARALGMTIAAHDPYLAADDPAWAGTRRCSLDDLLTQSDVVSLHVPLTEATAGMLGAKAIGRMKPGAILINTARGGIIDEAALVTALVNGTLGGAALDVFGDEPLDSGSGVVFEGCPNLILTPHIAGVTFEANARVSLVTVQNVNEILRGDDGRQHTGGAGINGVTS